MYRILIVDDNMALTMQLEEYLPTIGYEVAGIASSGSEAIEKARLGIASVPPAGATATLYFDSFESYRTLAP
jgi:DNA-binding NarL/FixJ family response regulator